MIIFDYDRYLKEIKDKGVSATDVHAKSKLKILMADYINNSSYKKGKIIENVRKTASDYFDGLPDDIIKTNLATLYDDVVESKYAITTKKKILKLYVSEMQTIEKIEDDKLRRLAFASLVAHKYYGYYEMNGNIFYHRSVNECMSDIYALADFKSVSGATRNKLQKQLSDMGLVHYFVKTNTAYKYNREWSAFCAFTVPFNADISKDREKEIVWMEMKNYDDIMLYLRYWLGDKTVTLCQECGTPILKFGNAKKLCSDCAANRKKESDNKRYKNRIVS